MCTPAMQQAMQGAGGAGVPPEIQQQIAGNPEQAVKALSAPAGKPKSGK